MPIKIGDNVKVNDMYFKKQFNQLVIGLCRSKQDDHLLTCLLVVDPANITAILFNDNDITRWRRSYTIDLIDNYKDFFKEKVIWKAVDQLTVVKQVDIIMPNNTIYNGYSSLKLGEIVVVNGSHFEIVEIAEDMKTIWVDFTK